MRKARLSSIRALWSPGGRAREMVHRHFVPHRRPVNNLPCLVHWLPDDFHRNFARRILGDGAALRVFINSIRDSLRCMDFLAST